MVIDFELDNLFDEKVSMGKLWLNKTLTLMDWQADVI